MNSYPSPSDQELEEIRLQIQQNRERRLARRRKQMRIRRIRILSVTIFFVLLVGGILALALRDKEPPTEEEPTIEENLPVSSPEEVTPPPVYTVSQTADTAQISAEFPSQYAVVIDAENGLVLAEKGSQTIISPASMTKILTLLVAVENITDWDQTFTMHIGITDYCFVNDCSVVGYELDEVIPARELLYGCILSSGADACLALAEMIAGSHEAFVDLMNQRAAELGMTDTHFVNCTGLDDDPAAKEHLTSAYDIALMSRQLMKNHPEIQKFTTIWMDTVRNGTIGLSNTNKLIRFYPGATGLKTGYTSTAGYCLSATAQRDGLGLVAVVMGCATSQDRFSACKQLLDYGFANYSLAAPQIDAQMIPVKLGVLSYAQAIPAQQPELLVDKSQRDQVHTELTLEETLAAPVSKGQRLGTLSVKVGDQTIAQIPMIAAEAVPKLTWSDLFLMVLRRLTMAK